MRWSWAAALVVIVGLGSAAAAETPAPPSATHIGCERKDIQAAIVAVIPQVTACYEGDLALGLDATGKYTVVFRIGPGGRVGKVVVASRGAGDAVFRLCLATAIQDARFVAPHGGECGVSYPFAFAEDPGNSALAAEIPTGIVASVNGVAVIAPGSALRFREILGRLSKRVAPDELFVQARQTPFVIV